MVSPIGADELLLRISGLCLQRGRRRSGAAAGARVRQNQDDGRAFTRNARHLQFAAVLFGESHGDRESQAGSAVALQAIGTNLPERLQRNLNFVDVHARTGIPDRNLHAAFRTTFGFDRNVAAGRRVFVCVREKIDKNLLDAAPVDHEHGKIRRKPHVQPLFLLSDAIADEQHACLDQFPDFVLLQNQGSRSRPL